MMGKYVKETLINGIEEVRKEEERKKIRKEKILLVIISVAIGIIGSIIEHLIGKI